MSLETPYYAPLPVALGGTGASTLAEAQTNLGIGGGGATVITTEAELAAAIAASEPNLMITASFSLTASHTLLVDTVIDHIANVSVTMGDFQIIGGAGISLALKGPGRNFGVSWTFTRASAGQAFNMSATSTLSVNGLNLVNSSAATVRQVCATSANQVYRDMELTLPGFASCGFTFGGDAILDEVIINTVVGSTSFFAGTSTGTLQATNIVIGGTLAGAMGTLGSNNSTGYIIGLDFTGSGSCTLTTGCAQVSNIIDSNGAGQLTYADSSRQVSDVDIDSLFAMGDHMASNIKCRDYSNSSMGARVHNLEITGTVLTTSRHTHITGFLRNSTSAVNVSGDDINIVNARVGTVFGGFSATFNIQAGSNRVHIVSANTDVAIVDSGTASVLVANSVF